MDQTIIDHHISILRGKLKGLKNTDRLYWTLLSLVRTGHYTGGINYE